MDALKKNNMYSANSHGQSLESHLLGVAKRSAQIFDAIDFVDEKSALRNQLVIASLFHDIGKLDPNFKNYIDSKVKQGINNNPKIIDAEIERKKQTSKSDYTGSYHNEVGWYLSRMILRNFSDHEKDNIGYAIYWHHPANLGKSGEFRFSNAIEIFNASQINTLDQDFNLFVDSLWKKAMNCDILGLSSLQRELNFFDISISPERIEKPNFWHTRSDNPAEKKLLLFILIESDRWVSSLSANDLEAFINNSSSFDFVWSKKQDFNLKQIPLEDTRTHNQIAIVNEIKKMNPIAICGIDPGEGKTRIGLRWWLEMSDRPLTIALPKQAQVTGIYITIQKDLKEIVSEHKDIRVIGFFNGSIQHDSHEKIEELDANIKILVFDRLLSPSYEISQVSEFVDMLFSDLILDEFHEFMFIPRMIDSVRDILTIRKWLKNTRTLLLSGTPEISILKALGLGDVPQVPRKFLAPSKNRLIELNYSDEVPIMSDIKPDTIVASLLVDDCQKYYKNHFENMGETLIPPYLIHSSFTANDRKSILNKILDKFSSGDGNGAVFSARLLQSSFDLNFRHGFIALSIPSVDIQFLGRINRYGDKDSDANVTFYYDSERSDFFYDNNFGFADLHNKWRVFLENKIRTNHGRKWKYREIINEIYEVFWSETNITKLVDDYIEKYRMQQEASLKQWFPSRYVKDKKKESNQLNPKKSKNSFREDSFFASARIVDDNGELISFLSGDNLLSVSSWKVNKMKNAIASQLAASLNKESNEHFNFNNYDNSKKGLIKERPLFFSHPNNSVDHDLKKGSLKDSNLYRVYHKKLGLCLPELLPLKAIEETNFNDYEDDDLLHSSKQSKFDENDVSDEGDCSVDTETTDNKDSISKNSSLKKNNADQETYNHSTRNYTQISEKQILVPLSRRVPIFYTEYCKVVRRGSDVRVLSDRVENEFTIPVASIGCLVLGPGTSVTAEAMRIATARGCKILVAGGEASPLFLSSTQHRSPLSRIRQYSVVMDADKRLKSGKILFKYRSKFIEQCGNEIIPKFPDVYLEDSIEKLLSVEGAWAKRAYKTLAQKYNSKWDSKRVANDKRHPIVFLNFLTYSIADIAILHLGYDPNVGVLHGRTKGGGLCYDLADIIKPVLALEGAFEAISFSYSLKEIKERFMSKVRELDVLDYLVEALNETFKSR